MVHCAWVLIAPAKLLIAVIPSLLIAFAGVLLASVGTALFWSTTPEEILGFGATVLLGMLALSSLTALCISYFYLKRKLCSDALSESASAP